MRRDVPLVGEHDRVLGAAERELENPLMQMLDRNSRGLGPVNVNWDGPDRPAWM